MRKFLFKNDKYKRSRGGYFRLLKICCEICGKDIGYYQKDGPGLLKRMYVDRLYDKSGLPIQSQKSLICKGCKEMLGVRVIYKKENRPAYRLFVGAVKKTLINSHQIKM